MCWQCAVLCFRHFAWTKFIENLLESTSATSINIKLDNGHFCTQFFCWNFTNVTALKVESVAKFASQNLSPSYRIPNWIDSYWNYWIFLSSFLSFFLYKLKASLFFHPWSWGKSYNKAKDVQAKYVYKSILKNVWMRIRNPTTAAQPWFIFSFSVLQKHSLPWRPIYWLKEWIWALKWESWRQGSVCGCQGRYKPPAVDWHYYLQLQWVRSHADRMSLSPDPAVTAATGCRTHAPSHAVSYRRRPSLYMFLYSIKKKKNVWTF